MGNALLAVTTLGWYMPPLRGLYPWSVEILRSMELSAKDKSSAVTADLEVVREKNKQRP